MQVTYDRYVRGAFLLHRLVLDKSGYLGGGCVYGAELEDVKHYEAAIVPVHNRR